MVVKLNIMSDVCHEYIVEGYCHEPQVTHRNKQWATDLNAIET